MMRFKIIPGYEIGVYISAKCGIYLIENPIGEVYIGASRDLPERVRQHKRGITAYGSNLSKSFFKHGRKNMKYYLLLELSEYADTSTINYFERLYTRQYRKDGYTVLNMKTGGYHEYKERGFSVKTKGFYIDPCAEIV